MTTRHTARMGAGLAVLPVLAMGWAVAEAHSFVVREQQAMVLPPGSEPIRVLHISDLHLLARQTSKIEFVRELARLHPD
ncbi:metallophosphoesterase, partial [Cutibacterium acnes]